MSPLFNRNKKTTIAELEEYYANQSSADSTARAWAMAVLSLLITVAVILALFFAGRWLWRVISDNDSDNTAATVQQEGVTVLPDGTLSGDLSLLNNSSNTLTGGTVSVDSGTTTESGDEGVVSDEAASTTVSNTDTVSSSTVTGASSNEETSTTSEIPNTGAGAILLAPIIAGAAGYTASISRKRR